MYKRSMKLRDLLFHNVGCQQAALDYPDSFGVEVELEGKGIINPPEVVQAYWRIETDGSLRKLQPGDEAIEYVFRKPLNIDHAEMAINYLFGYLQSPKVSVYDSYRTSIHVHVNCATETYRTIYNLITLCLIFDELFVSQNGEHRIGNNFCLRAKDALGQVTQLIHSVHNGHGFAGIDLHQRYSSINFASLLKYGSIEFRSLECTLHIGRVMQWIHTLQQLKNAAKTFVNPVEIISQFSVMQPRKFIEDILGPYSLKYLAVPQCESMLYNGMRLAQDFAYSSDWKE